MPFSPFFIVGSLLLGAFCLQSRFATPEADPNIPEEEKQAFRQSLVHQKAWRAPRFSMNGS